jgi:hypothetical protein
VVVEPWLTLVGRIQLNSYGGQDSATEDAERGHEPRRAEEPHGHMCG